jgi:VIT1/CCC1 family predicted Fe2+/Mn2+ transporter
MLYDAFLRKCANRAIIYTIGIGVFLILVWVAIAMQSWFFTVLCVCLAIVMIWKSISEVYRMYE